MTEHPELSVLLDLYDPDGEVPHGAARPEIVVHLRGCALCRSAVAGVDPSALFALLGTEPVPEGLLDRLSAGVEAAIEAADPELSGGARVAPRWSFASIAASLLLAGLLGTYLWQGPGQTASAVRVEFGGPAEAGFELLSSPGTAQVLDLSVGDTELVMIFDKDLDL